MLLKQQQLAEIFHEEVINVDANFENQIKKQEDKMTHQYVRIDSCPKGLDDLNIILYDMPPGKKLDFLMHWHSAYEITFPLRGELDFLMDGRVYHLVPGDVLFVDASTLHGPNESEYVDAHYISIHVGNSFLCPSYSGYLYNRFFKSLFSGELAFGFQLHRDMPVAGHIYKLLLGIYADFGEIGDKALSVQADILKIFSFLYAENLLLPAKGSRNSDDAIKDALNIIASSFKTPITVAELATSVNMSEGQFCRQFKKATNTTPKDYILRTRLKYAMNQMQYYPNKQTGEIAFEAGFTEANYFSRLFREKFGLSPTAYRKHLVGSNTKA